MTDPAGRHYYVTVELHVRAETAADRDPDNASLQTAADIAGPPPEIAAAFDETRLNRDGIAALRDGIWRLLDTAPAVEPCPRDNSPCAVICGARAICTDHTPHPRPTPRGGTGEGTAGDEGGEGQR